MGCVFPRSPGLDSFWANIESGVCASREAPPGRWLLSKEDAFSPEKGAPDRVYSPKACFVEDFSLNPSGLGLDRAFLDELDPACHLALYAARQAAASCKIKDRSRVPVIIGNIALPTEKASAYARQTLLPALLEKALGEKTDLDEKAHPANLRAAGLPAGVLARAFGFGGGTLSLDAACASSLYAVKLACDELLSGRADAVLTGGVSRPDSLYTQMGFSQLRALSPSGRPAPFDAGADGLVVGEGAGMLVLKRLEDAIADGDEIHALLCGAGLSNDVGGSLLAPNSAGQLRAMRAAYRQAGWAPQQVDYVECHATGTPAGDPVEIASLKTLWGARGWTAGQCALGSVKANIGHLLTAAGAAGLIKVILAMKHGKLPPMANFSRPHQALSLDGSPFAIPQEARAWEKRGNDEPRRAAVSAFGFGGINAHLLVQEYQAQAARPARAERPAQDQPIAIVGMEAVFGGGAHGLERFRKAVLGGPGHTSVSEPAARWRGLPGAKGRYLDDARAPSGKYRIPPKELQEMLPQQLLMLEAAAGALEDAGVPSGDRDAFGVFIGLELDPNTTNFSLRWALPEIARRHAARKGWKLSPADEAAFIEELRRQAGPALSANRTMGALASIAASRIAREFQIGGPSFALSSGDASGLRAVELAVRLLRQGDIDCALAGAVDLGGDPRSVLSRARLQGLAPGGVSGAFDKSACGHVPGEGAAAFVLKRLEDARRDGDRVYAVIKGAGSASSDTDGSGPLLNAFSRAWRDAQADPSSLGLLEAHGSACAEQDRVEASAIREFFAASGGTSCALTTAKNALGHAGAASGMAGAARAALALYHEILPPLSPLNPIDELKPAAARFHAPVRPLHWLRNRADGPRRAAVTALGMDGSCSHLVLEQYAQQQTPLVEAERRQPLGRRGEALFAVYYAPGREHDTLRRLEDWISKRPDAEPIEDLARGWLAENKAAGCRTPLVLSARTRQDLLSLSRSAGKWIKENPAKPLFTDRISWSAGTAYRPEEVAFVFPGSGNHYIGMGADIGVLWPEVMRALDAENARLSDQFVPKRFVPQRLDWSGQWFDQAERELNMDFHAMIFGTVSCASAYSDLLRSFGLQPRYALGYSLGETAGLFALRAWTARDEMLSRMKSSSLFVSDLAGPCEAVRRFWNLPKDERMEWVLGVIDRPADSVHMALKGMEKAALLIVNAPFECVIGGYKKAVDSLVSGLGCVFLPLQGVSAVHFKAAELVEKQYRELHLFPTKRLPGVKFYSGAWKKAYEVTRESAADSITAQSIRSLDFPGLVRQAYEDGARVFIETGPQSSCTRMIGKILSGKAHLAVPASVKPPQYYSKYSGKHGDFEYDEEYSVFLRALARLLAHGLPVSLAKLYPERQPARRADSENFVTVPHGPGPAEKVSWTPSRSAELPAPPALVSAAPAQSRPPAAPPRPLLAPKLPPVPAPPVPALRAPAQVRSPMVSVPDAELSPMARAHAAFLRLSANYARFQSSNIAFQQSLIAGGAVLPPQNAAQTPMVVPPAPAPLPPKQAVRAEVSAPVFMNKEQCFEFAKGKIANVLGQAFAHADTYPTRVRLPDGPLMLVDRILSVKGEPGSLKSGTVVTEHDVLPGAWYLDAGRIPTCVAVEAGQADLFLSGYLGIDERTKGLAVYRLLDAEVEFHSDLPRPGETIHYEINIERFARHGDIWLFFFNFESTVGGKPLMSMRKGCAGFFTAEELARGKGVVFKEGDLDAKPGKIPADWPQLAPPQAAPETLDAAAVDALRAGDYGKAFGPAFAKLDLRDPLLLPSGMMKLVDSVKELDLKGGRFGLGRIYAEAAITPKDWHLACHFVDDHVMPGTLMYECCLHTFRILLARMGLLSCGKECWCGPVPGVTSKLECRGQVLETTKKAGYEIVIKELGFRPEPYAIADALMYAFDPVNGDANGRAIVRITDMSIRLCGIDRPKLEALWGKAAPAGEAAIKPKPGKPIFDNASIMAFAVGKPSEAFGEPYKIFDSGRVIARLPGPPYKFLDRITRIENAAPFKLAAGGEVTAEYDVPPDEWYFAAEGQPTMPFGVLLEVALQPCGWLAAYLGSALTSQTDLSFRNLGGTAVQHMAVTPQTGTLYTDVKITKVSSSAGMIIQDYDMHVRCAAGTVYKGVTQFGFFSKKALSEQIGVRGAKPYVPSEHEIARGITGQLSGPLIPGRQLLMVDSVPLLVPDGGPKGLGFLRGIKKVDPAEWFFKAHFYQDPVCPGSLGLESFIQLLKVYALRRWPDAQGAKFECMALGAKHTWVYRGQVVPTNKEVTVEAAISSVDEASRTLSADGWLKVDGLPIYQMRDFSLRMVKP
ncbi:MAG: type I polyketide synthase [Elusimicrobia bacterium]|nr:type I polyketide synthase [Elusimicrobiota bacterium]